MIDPGSNINCVGYDWITRFDTPEWSYNLECGSIKTAGGHNLDVEGGSTLFMVKMVLSLALLPVMHLV